MGQAAKLWTPASPAIIGRPRLVTPGFMIVEAVEGGIIVWRAPDRYCRATPMGALAPLARLVPQYIPTSGTRGPYGPGTYPNTMPKYNTATFGCWGASGGGGGGTVTNTSTSGTAGGNTTCQTDKWTLAANGGGGGARGFGSNGANGATGSTSGPSGYTVGTGFGGGAGGFGAAQSGAYSYGGDGGAGGQANYTATYGAPNGPTPGATITVIVGNNGTGGSSSGNLNSRSGANGTDGKFQMSWS